MANHDGNNKNVSLSSIAGYGASDSDSDDTESQSKYSTGNDDSDAAEVSEMVMKNNIINACAHGPLSRPSQDVESSRHMIIDSVESGVVEYEVTEYRDIDSDSDSSSSDSSSDVDSVKDVEEGFSGEEDGKPGKPEAPKVHGEMGLDELPPIEDLAISLPSQECTKIGTIASVVDRLVIIRAFPETPAVDLDSVLFIENGAKALGKVFDVFGPVTEPHYCVRFNSQQHVKERGVHPGMEVFIAPNNKDTTSYVFLNDLIKIKGSDASWLNDIEPPPQHVEYSDDEDERRANKARKEQRQNKPDESDGETCKKDKNPKRNLNRPSQSSSRFGGPSRGRNPFTAGSRRNPNNFQRFVRPFNDGQIHTPQRCPPVQPRDGIFGPHEPNRPFPAPFAPSLIPMFPHAFNTPPPFLGNTFQFGGNPRMNIPMPSMEMLPRARRNVPIFGQNFCNMGGQQPQWTNNAQPPPPGT